MKRHRLLVAVFASMALAGWAGDTEIIVESYADGLNSAAFSKVDGKWNESTAKSTAEGLQATKAVYNDANTEPGTARFTPQIPVTGKYDVFITYATSGNASDVKYTVVSADGSKDIILTQNGRDLGHSPTANQWYSLGTFTFNEGNSGYIELSDPLTGAKPLANEPNARIYADAVKLVPVGMSLPADYVNAGKSAGAATTAAPTPTPAVVAAATTPTPAASTGGPVVPGLPSLPGTPAAAPTPAAGLPALPAESTPGLPALPPATAGAAQALPGLPSDTPPAAAMPALPETPVGQPGLPDLPGAQASASTITESSVVTAQATPLVTPNLPSLAPVTPTPQRNMPSPADTPVAGVPGSLPGGPLASMTPALPPPGAALPGAPSMPATLPAAVPGAPTAGRSDSITQSNPANLQWMYDFGAALNVARARDKKVMVFFTAPGNTVADTYENQYFAHPAVRQALNNYVLVKVNFPQNTRLGYSLGIFGAGIVVVTDSTGDVLVRVEQIPATPQDLIKLMAGVQPVKPAAPASAVQPAGAPGAPAADATATTATVPAVTEVQGGVPPMPGAVTPAVTEIQGGIPPMPGAVPPAVTEVQGGIPPMPGATPPAPPPPGAPPVAPGAPGALPALPGAPGATPAAP